MNTEPMTRVRTLTGAYLTISVLTVAAVVLLRHHPSLVADAVWVRTTIVAASALLLTVFAVRAAGGSARAYLRLRIVSAIVLVATAVVVAVPGAFPPWLRIEQAVCGLFLLGVVAIANSRPARAAMRTS